MFAIGLLQIFGMYKIKYSLNLKMRITSQMFTNCLPCFSFHSDFGGFTTFKFGMTTDQEIKDHIKYLVKSIQDEYITLAQMKVDDDDSSSEIANKKPKMN